MDDQSPAASPRRRSVWRLACYWLSSALIVMGCLMQATVRDRVPYPLTMLYYGLPRPVLLVLAVVTAMVAGRSRSRWVWAAIAGLLALGVGRWDVEFHRPQGGSERSQTVVYWNVGRNLVDDVVAVDAFLDSAPDLVGLVETGSLSPEWLDDWRQRRPDYEFIPLPDDCLLAVRGTVLDHGEIPLPSLSYANWVDADLQGTVVRVVMVDIAANLWISRKEPLLQLTAALRASGNRPTVVMGDFNTPDESVWLTDWKGEYREVFRTAGTGYAPTWPWPVPVLKLDQVWISQEIGLDQAWQTGSWRSDHRAVWAKVRWPVE